MNKEDKNSKKPSSWEELVFTTIEKIAAAPSKLKDPKESVLAAFDWVRSIRDDIEQRVLSDVSERLKQIDWEVMGKKVGEHLADRYDLEIVSKISLKPKASEDETEHDQKR